MHNVNLSVSLANKYGMAKKNAKTSVECSYAVVQDRRQVLVDGGPELTVNNCHRPFSREQGITSLLTGE